MRILIVTTRVPYPPFKGDKLKIYNIVKHLARKHQVKILCLAKSKAEFEYLDNIRSLGAEIDAVHHSTLRSILIAGLKFFSKKPIQVSLFDSKQLRERLAKMVNQDTVDVIYFHFIRAAQYLESVPSNKAVRVLDFTDAVSLYLSRFVKTVRNPFVRLLVRTERNRISNYEWIAEKFDACFICSPIDRDYLISKGIKAKFFVLPNGVDTDMFKASTHSPEGNRIIFTGNMPYFPNEDAAIYLAETIFPKVLESVPSAKLYLVGGNPTRKIRKLASDKVIVTGFVNDIVAEYQKSAVAVAPMRFGAGTLNKVIEPIVLGVPVVATSIAVRGLPDTVQRVIRVADSPDDFASAIIDVLQSRNLVNSGDKLDEIRNALSWERIVDEFESNLIAVRGCRNGTSRDHVDSTVARNSETGTWKSFEEI